MKTKYLIIGLLLMTMPTKSFTQIGGNIFDNVKMDDEDKKELKATWDIMSNEFSQYTDDTMVGGCLKLMANHAEKLAKLQEQINNLENDCEQKNQLLEYQALVVLSGGTKLFCPDELISNKALYAEEILIYLATHDVFIDGVSEVDMIMRKFKDAQDLLGNKITLKTSDWEGTIPRVRSNLKENKPIYYGFNPAERGFYTLLIDYFTYYLSPGFMLKKPLQIDAQRCD